MNNDDIIRMALSAGLEKDGDNFFSRNYDQVDVHIDDLKRFAELIVRECLKQCYDRGMNDELYAGQLKAAAYIEEYFGVEA